MGKKYRWNWRVCMKNMAALAFMAACGIGFWYLMYLWAMA